MNIKDYTAPADLLQDRVILITGAGQGIGRETALACARHGATVVLHGRSVKKLEAVYDAIEEAGGPQPAIFPLDLEQATETDFEAMVQGIEQNFQRLDGIVHLAARLDMLSPLEDQSMEQWLKTLRVNLVAPVALTRACLPLLKEAPDASVVMTLETHGHAPAAYWGSFAVSKHALEAVITIWSQELEIFPQLRLNGIVPGPVHSPQRNRTHPAEIKAELPPISALMPYYLYLLGKDSATLHGQVLQVAQAG